MKSMKFQTTILSLFILLFVKTATAQSFEGVWKGTALCQIKNSPCKDEIVVYRIKKNSSGTGYEMNAYKIVNGKEDYMGPLPFTYEDKQKVFVSIDSARNDRWVFKVTGNTMKGTLHSNGDLYRIIDVKKED